MADTGRRAADRDGEPDLAREPIRVATVGPHVVTLLPRAGYDVAYVPGSGVIGFAFESQHGSHAFASDRCRPFQAWPNTLSWVPAGCDVRSRSATGGEYLKIVSGDAHVGERSDRRAAARDERRFSGRRDACAWQAARAIRTHLLRGDDDQWALEDEIERLHERVDVQFGEGGRGRDAASTCLTPARLRRVDDWIEAHLADRTSVSALAAELGLSAGFVTRAMKAATGRAPHDYVIDRRVARARALLRGTRRTASDIALECGFSSHSHLGATLRTRLGVTPGTLRGTTNR